MSDTQLSTHLPQRLTYHPISASILMIPKIELTIKIVATSISKREARKGFFEAWIQASEA